MSFYFLSGANTGAHLLKPPLTLKAPEQKPNAKVCNSPCEVWNRKYINHKCEKCAKSNYSTSLIAH
jgi:hypothetical protein